MKTLIIIGNGFDIGHKLKSKFEDFGIFLRDNNEELFNAIIFLLENPNERIINPINYFKRFEERLQYLFLNNIIEYDAMQINSLYEEMIDEEIGPISYRDIESHYQPQYLKTKNNLIKGIIEYYEMWIGEINEDIYNHKRNLKPFYQQLIEDTQNKILSFNHTDTIEELYNRENIVHIHGRYSVGDKLIVGHKSKNYNIEYEEDSVVAQFYKSVNLIIEKNKKILESYNDIAQIYVIGCSLSDVDMPYFIKISSVAAEAMWNIVYFDEKQKQEFKDIIENNLQIKYKLIPSDKVYC